jgi:hypothetical protein
LNELLAIASKLCLADPESNITSSNNVIFNEQHSDCNGIKICTNPPAKKALSNTEKAINTIFSTKVQRELLELYRTHYCNLHHHTVSEVICDQCKPAEIINLECNHKDGCDLKKFRADYEKVATCTKCPGNYEKCLNPNSVLGNVVEIYKQRISNRSTKYSGTQLIYDKIWSILDKACEKKNSVPVDPEAIKVQDTPNLKKLLGIKLTHSKCEYFGAEICFICFRHLYGYAKSTLYEYWEQATVYGIRNFNHKNEGRSGKKTFSVETALNTLEEIIDEEAQMDPAATRNQKPIIHLPDHSITAFAQRLNKQLGEVYEDVSISERSVRTFIREKNASGEVEIKVSRSKDNSTCDDCARLDNKIGSTKDPKERNLLKLEKKQHQTTASLQRKKFYKHLAKSYKDPHHSWTIQMDGMDQAKSLIPHLSNYRKAKGLDKHMKMKYHIRGVLCVGGPIPAAAYLCDESVTNDADLSITILQDFLRKSLVEPPLRVMHHCGELIKPNSNTHINHRNYNSNLDAQSAGKDNGNGNIGLLSNNSTSSRSNNMHDLYCTYNDYIPCERSEEQVCSVCVNDKSKCRTTIYSNRLPKKLYIQLDNATKDNKNKAFMSYLALLVCMGYFDSIKVGFEIVGHTHDKIDQVFSRFSIALNHQNAITVKQLKHVLQLAYASHFSDSNDGNKNQKTAKIFASVRPMICEVKQVAAATKWIYTDLKMKKILEEWEGVRAPHIMKIAWNLEKPKQVWIWSRSYAETNNCNMKLLPGHAGKVGTNRNKYESDLLLLDYEKIKTLWNLDPFVKPLSLIPHFQSIVEAARECEELGYSTNIETKEWEKAKADHEQRFNKDLCSECQMFMRELSKIVIPSRIVNDGDGTESSKRERLDAINAKAKIKRELDEHQNNHDQSNIPRWKDWWKATLGVPLFGPNYENTEARLQWNREFEAKNVIQLSQQDMPLNPVLKFRRKHELQQNWDDLITPGMIVAIELNSYQFPIYPGFCFAIVSSISSYGPNGEQSIDGANRNQWLKVQYLEPTNIDPKSRQIAAHQCYLNQRAVLQLNGKSDEEIEQQLCVDAIEFLRLYDENLQKQEEVTATIEPVEVKQANNNNKRKKAQKPNQKCAKLKTIGGVDYSDSFSLQPIANGSRDLSNIPCTYEPLDILYWQYEVAVNYKERSFLEESKQYDKIVQYRLDEKGEKVPNNHIVNSQNKQLYSPKPVEGGSYYIESNPNSESTSYSIADSKYLYECTDDIIEKASCFCWTEVQDAFQGAINTKKNELAVDPITGWPKRIQHLRINKRFMELILKSMEQRKQDLPNEITDDTEMSNEMNLPLKHLNADFSTVYHFPNLCPFIIDCACINSNNHTCNHRVKLLDANPPILMSSLQIIEMCQKNAIKPPQHFQTLNININGFFSVIFS